MILNIFYLNYFFFYIIEKKIVCAFNKIETRKKLLKWNLFFAEDFLRLFFTLRKKTQIQESKRESLYSLFSQSYSYFINNAFFLLLLLLLLYYNYLKFGFISIARKILSLSPLNFFLFYLFFVFQF